jgi:hypothetical protein
VSKNPSATFYWKDWEEDPALRSCSLAAQGLWMRLLCVAARSPELGVVLIAGQDCRIANLPLALARVVGEVPEVLTRLIDELVGSGAASLDKAGRLYCRRMVRAAALSKKRARSGALGAAVTNGNVTRINGLPRQTSGENLSKAGGK